MKYSKIQQEQSFALYRELKVLSRVSEHMSIPLNILSKWKKDNKWDERVDRDNAALALTPLNQDQNVARICERFAIPKEDGEVLKQIKLVEGICMATIKGKQEITDRLGLTPPNWDSAVKSLDVCWKWRDRIFERKLKRDGGDESIGTHAKPNIVVAVQQTMRGGEVADNTITVSSDGKSRKILPEQASDSEWREDQELE